MLKILAHVAAIIGLYLAFSFVLFLGLQVSPLYGNVGLVVVIVLVAFYVYMGFGRRLSPNSRHSRHEISGTPEVAQSDGDDPCGVVPEASHSPQGVEEPSSRVSDAESLGPVIAVVLAENPGKVREFRSGREDLLGYFIGQVMVRTGGKADPAVVMRALRSWLRGDGEKEVGDDA